MKIKIKQYLLLLAIGIFVLGAKAQDEPMEFSLYQATQFAMKNSYVLENTGKDITLAQQKVWETITTGLPQVSGTANYNAFLNLPVSLIPAEFVGGEPGTYIPVQFGQDYSSDFGFSVAQQIFDGSWIVGVTSAELYVSLSQQAHEKTEIDIRDAVSRAYYMVLISERYKTVMEENLANRQKLHNETKIYFENGFREEQDVDQLKILLKTAENEVYAAERELTVAQTVLKYAMGYDLDMEILLNDNLELFVLPLVNKENTFNFDFTNHIDYQLATSNFELSEKLVKLEKSTYLPKLDAFYSYSKTAYSNNANLFKEDWYPSSLVGFQATIPIFNSGNKRSKVKQAKIEREQAETDRILTQITLEKDYLTASAEMETAIDQFQNDTENRDLARSILDKSQIKFNAGMISSAELSQQETQYINAFQALVGSTMSLLESHLRLKKAIGAL